MVAFATAVLGAGVAGLSVALALARAGQRVTLIDRDDLHVGPPLDAVNWPRRGIPHFLQPHAFIPRGRRELRESFPDVFAALLEAGAWDFDLRPKIQGPKLPEDEELAYIGVRRPLIEWALRRAALAEPSIRVLPAVRALGLDGERGEVPQVTGVQTTEGTLPADLVVDAMGRRSPMTAWIEALGGTPLRQRSSDCGIIYYCRYYQVREGVTLPDGPWLPTPRGDLGYAAFSTFPGDNRTFATVLAIPPGDQALKALRDVPPFDAASTLIPALASWTNTAAAVPITDVLPMGSLQNTIRTLDDQRLPATGVVSVGDALVHTDPVLALGLSFSLIHARLLAAAVRDHAPRLDDVATAFYGAARPDMEERFALATAIDSERGRRWAGEAVDITRHDGGAYALFTLIAGTAAALVDGEIFRVVVRRNTFLDPLSVLDEDEHMQQRIDARFADLLAQRGARSGPTRDELLGAIEATPLGATRPL